MKRNKFSLLTLAALTLASGLFYLNREHNSKSPSSDLEANGGTGFSGKTSAGLSHSPSNVMTTELPEWEKRWQELLDTPDSPERDAELTAIVETLAATEPGRAIALAQQHINPDLRKNLLKAALRGWSRVNSFAAAEWAVSQGVMKRWEAVAVVMEGLGQNPEEARRVAEWLMQLDPDREREHGHALIESLRKASEFSAAVELAVNATGHYRVDWIEQSYGNWTKVDPKKAAESAMQIGDPNARKWAFEAVMDGWPTKDPEGLVDYALTLPEGRERSLAFSRALQDWTAKDLVAAATWMAQFDPAPDLDEGISVVATRDETIQQDPITAILWAEQISSPTIKSVALSTVIKTWALSDFSAARQFAENCTSLTPESRRELFMVLGQMAGAM